MGKKLSVVYNVGSSGYTYYYSGNCIYRNGTLEKILVDGGYITLSGTTPTYHYYLQDHLGNNRVVCNASGTIKQVNHYYPFGGLFGESTGGSTQVYKYNGKEFDRINGLDLYDYGARHMSPDIGRFTTIDPKAEKYYNMSPYAYCANNPVNAIDLDGLDWLHVRGDTVFWYGGDVGDTSELMYSFASTSGYAEYDKDDNIITSYQKAVFQSIEDYGPTPEGEYEINLTPSPDRHAQRKGSYLVPNDLGGIEMTEYDENGIHYSSPEWGKYRARMTPKSVKRKMKRNIKSFYIHDSEKGYTHGCIEIEHSFFDLLRYYRISNNSIKVIVQYPSPKHITNGGTKK